MNFDINEVLAQMLGAMKGSLKEDWGAAKDTVTVFMQNRKARLALLADLLITGQISKEFFELRLKEEQEILEAELHAIAIITKVAAQNAANAAIKVLAAAVRAVIG